MAAEEEGEEPKQGKQESDPPADSLRIRADRSSTCRPDGVLPKDNRRGPYRPGVRSPAWLKVKRRLTLRVQVLDGRLI